MSSLLGVSDIFIVGDIVALALRHDTKFMQIIPMEIRNKISYLYRNFRLELICFRIC